MPEVWQVVVVRQWSPCTFCAFALELCFKIKMRISDVCLCMLLCICFHAYVWCFTRLMRNQLTHALNGNMNKGTKGKGKNKPIDHEVEFASAIRSALPEAAQLRLQSKLLQDEWDAPICEPQHLTSSGGVAICGKEVLPDLLARVGYTAKPCAILVAQEPDTLHLQGYPRSKVRCTYDVAAEGATRKHVEVERFLVQIGFSAHVQMVSRGTEVQLQHTMVKMVARCPKYYGWSQGQLPATVLTNFLEKHVDVNAFSEVVSRDDASFTCLCHKECCDVLLRASGDSAIFVKIHSSDDGSPMELLWLDRSVSLDTALTTAKEKTVFGLACKGQQGHLALRFRSTHDLCAFASAHGLTVNTDLQRWKVSGIPCTTGLQGLHDILKTLGWQVEDIVYQDDFRAVFTATAKGSHDMAHFHFDGQPRTIRFKAVNAASRSAAASSDQQARQILFRPSERIAKQKEFLAKMAAPAKAPGSLQAPASPRNVPAKQKATDRTGETPDGQRAKP